MHGGVSDVTFLCAWKFCCLVVAFGAVSVRDGGNGGLLVTDAGDAVFVGTLSRSGSTTGTPYIPCSDVNGDATCFNSPTLDPRAVHCDIYEGRVSWLVWPSTIVSPSSDISEFVREFV